MDYENCRSLPAMFFAQAERGGERPFLWTKREGRYQPLGWAAAARAIRRLAGGLIALGIEPGDRVALISENRSEWAIADLAIMSAGAISVPGYVTSTIDMHRHVLTNSGARAVIVSMSGLGGRVIPAVNQVPTVHSAVTLAPSGKAADAPAFQPCTATMLSWDDALAMGDANGDAVDNRLAALRPDDIACILYTSGTGGVPKGVMATHRNIIANCRGAHHVLATLGLGAEIFLNFLPLSHSYEHTAGMMFPISLGAEIYFAEGVETLAANMREARPTIMTAVPRLYEAMYQRMRLAVAREGKLKRRLFESAVALGRKRLAAMSLTRREALLDRLVERLVRRKIKARFGGRLKAMVSGGAPLSPEIGSFFLALGVPLLQGYGQTEAAPVICCNPPSHIKIDTVGPPLDGVALRFAEDGEILVCGDNVMKGYWNDPEATARTLEGDWLRTGDVGHLDAEGYLRITDRKRDFIKNSGGEMISPARVEGRLTIEPEIAQALVYGDRRPHLVAVLVPEAEFLAHYAHDHAIPNDAAALAGDPGLIKAIGAAVARANQELSPVERVRRFIIAAEPFTVANGQMTPTLKIRRHAIREAYGSAIDLLYQDKGIAA